MPHVAIPGGVWRDGAPPTESPRREVALRPVGGEDEAFLLDTADGLAPSARATSLLARCLEGADARDARALTVGDREALLLQLRRLTLGEDLDCVLHCPAVGCGERMELALRVSDLLVPAYAEVRREHQWSGEGEGSRYDVTFRLPTAADLDPAATLARSDPEQGALRVLDACVVRAARDAVPISAPAFPHAVRGALSAAIAERDPQAEIELDVACPACGGEFSVVFDTATFFLQELDGRAAQLTMDVHTLASHYHWSERDILRMPRRRRARYLELVADARARVR